MRRLYKWFARWPLVFRIAFVSAIMPWLILWVWSYAHYLWYTAECLLDPHCTASF